MNNLTTILQFALEKAEQEPLPNRVKIYRAMARICGDPQDEAFLNQMAVTLERAEKFCADFKSSFVQKTTVQ